jgi:hypothetical protein
MNIRFAGIFTILLGTLSAGITPAMAQDEVGVLAGVNSANVNFESEMFTIEGDSRTGFAAGLYWTRALQGALGVEVDALFAQKGVSLPASVFGNDIALKVSYLDIPVLARYSRLATTSVGFQAYIGPSFNLKLGDTIEVNGIEQEEDSGIESFETAVVFGGGVAFGRVRVDARYGLGLTSLADAADAEFAASVKNRVFSVLVGFRLR